MSETEINSAQQENNVDWTNQELQEWVNAGLIPNDLLEESKSLALLNFIRKNKQTLQTLQKKYRSQQYHHKMNGTTLQISLLETKKRQRIGNGCKV